jgi:hypothetical protein
LSWRLTFENADPPNGLHPDGRNISFGKLLLSLLYLRTDRISAREGRRRERSTCFIHRIIGIQIHIRRLLRLAMFSTYASFFSKKAVIHCCPSIVKAVRVDAHALLQQLGDYDDFVVAEHAQE